MSLGTNRVFAANRPTRRRSVNPRRYCLEAVRLIDRLVPLAKRIRDIEKVGYFDRTEHSSK